MDDPTARSGRRPHRVTKLCPGCGRSFDVPVSNAARYNFCSRECSSASRAHASTCRRCGSPFRYSQTQIRHYCSESCRRPPVLVTCECCGADFRATPSKAATGRRYCSRRCYVASDAETGIERKVRLILESERLRFAAQAQVGPWVVDFRVGNLVIEADGDYWHALRPGADRRKTRDLTQRGLTVWRIPEHEINAAGFADALKRRLADHEVVDGKLARLDPGEMPVTYGEDAMVGRHAEDTPADREGDQLVLSF